MRQGQSALLSPLDVTNIISKGYFLGMENLLDKQIAINPTISDSPYKENILKALEMVHWAINSRELREFILNSSFSQTDKDGSWHLDRFVLGSERGTEVDYEWDFNIRFITLESGTIAFSYPRELPINLNTRFLDREMPEICNTLVHEYCHLVGMVHSVENPGWRIWYRTAPYAIGRRVQEIVAKKFGYRESWLSRIDYWFKSTFR